MITKDQVLDADALIACVRHRATDLFYAVSESSLEKATACLAARVDPNFRDYEQRCPLHIAAGCCGDDLSIMQLLLDHRANVNVIDNWGMTPLVQCQKARNARAEQLLKDNGAKLQRKNQSMREKWEIKRSDVKIGRELSVTLKNAVHHATWNGVEVVAKFSRADAKDISSEELEQEMLNEIALLATIRHPDLVLFLGCCLQESPIMFITQFMPSGDLEAYYESRRLEGVFSASTKVVNHWGCSIARALNFLHTCSQPIIHRDLKPLNILLTANLDAKVTDFGISKVTGADFGSRMTGGVGSWRYMAPENARHQEYTEKIDIYAFALILYFMSSGRQPFHEYKNPVNILDDYAKGNEPRPKASECAAQFRPIMEAAWDKVPEQRPSAADLFERLIEARARSNKCACSVM